MGGCCLPFLESEENYSSASGGTTSSFGNGYDGYNVVDFSQTREQGWTAGFAYGPRVSAGGISQSIGDRPESYLWSRTYGSAQPFTQMYLRPKLTTDQLVFPSPDAHGVYSGSQRRALPQSGAELTQWGATGYANGRQTEMNTQVQAFAQVGNTVFLGGNFAQLDRDRNGSGRFAQPYVAGVDVDSGEPVRTFTPQLNGQVKAMTEVDGHLAIGGEFTEVNGQAREGFAVLDPVTGELVPEWEKVRVENRTAVGFVQVKAMEVSNGQLYLGGSFTHTTGADGRTAWARNGVRITVDDRTADARWNPNLNGTANDISVSPDGQQIFTAGYFNQSKGQHVFRLASHNAQDGAPAHTWDWEPSYRPDDLGGVWGFQLAVRSSSQNRVWAGGAEHLLHGYDPTTLQRIGSSITRSGGDFQSISVQGSTLFGSCHCGDWNYHGGSRYLELGRDFTIADQISLIGAWDEHSGEYLPEFNPRLKGPGGWGVWASFTDSRGVLWAGGSIDRSQSVNGRTQWSGGFVRFAPRDVTAPSAPQSMKAETAAGRDHLTWSASEGKDITYQILRNGKVIGSTPETSFEIEHLDQAQYAVRSADGAGNYSASTPEVKGEATLPEPLASEPSEQPMKGPEEGRQLNSPRDPEPDVAEQKSAAVSPEALPEGGHTADSGFSPLVFHRPPGGETT